jgi:hypothetical protein
MAQTYTNEAKFQAILEQSSVRGMFDLIALIVADLRKAHLREICLPV